MGVASAKDTTAKANRAETSEGIFRVKEGYGYAMGLMDRQEERTKNKNKNKNQIFMSVHQSRSTHTSTD
jgi:hypothetical protein